jgi:hypothetical protein
MRRAGRDDKKLADLDELIEKITVDAYGDDEELWAFRQAFEDDVTLPSDGFVIGEPVSVTEIDYDGNERRGLTARCRRENGSEHVVAASDVVFRGARAAPATSPPTASAWASTLILPRLPGPRGASANTRLRPRTST